VKVINADVLSCLDDMFYRLPFPNQMELEKLIKDAQGVTQMSDFRAEIRDDLNEPRALKEFESGWDKYWNETKSQKRAASKGQQSKSIKDRIRKAAPATPEDTSGDGRDGENVEDHSLSQPEKVPRRLSLLLPVLHSLLSPAFPADNPFHTAGGQR
jgi:hypothetical protein